MCNLLRIIGMVMQKRHPKEERPPLRSEASTKHPHPTARLRKPSRPLLEDPHDLYTCPSRPLYLSVSSSSLIRPKSREPVPPAPPASPSRRRTPAERELRRSHLRERQSTGSLLSLTAVDTKATPTTHLSGGSSGESSVGQTPHNEYTKDEVFGAPGPLKIDPLLAALEAASRVNVKSRCAVCGKQGVNFPKCQKCGMTFCSRECRTSTVEGAAGGKHACVA